MTKAEIARQAAIDRVGDAYVYGAWDQQCTVANRNRYANLNSEYKDAIRNQCQRQKSGKSSCAGCCYEGRRIHDCRGLTSACAAAAGITTITGQTVAKQWNASVWAEKGTIDTLPKELPYVQLFRHNGSKWTHTGCYIGNGETVDARGHANGVIRSKLTSYSWTHWAIPKGMYDELPDTGGDQQVIWTGVVNTEKGRLNVRVGPGTDYRIIGSLPKGEEVDVFSESGDWAFIAGDGLQGYVCLKYIRKASEGPVSAPEDVVGETPAPLADPPENAILVGVWIPCYSEAEAQRWAGNIKGAVILRADKPPDAV